ncbi:MAG TPA: GrdX family protein [Selenomonadales bacterium]|nr:GrdX family protein [Selenomonadales bacterium]
MRLIVTNNPLVEAYISAHGLDKYYQIAWIEGYTEDVLRHVRNLCHSHHRLITHPLTGSVKPNHTPFKTVVLEQGDAKVVDLESVQLAEAGLGKALDLLKSRPRPEAAFRFSDDFAVIDLDFFKSYLLSVVNYPG